MPEESIARLFAEGDEDAEELFLLMNGNTRIPRNIRAKWFFDHLGQKVRISEDDKNENEDISIVGVIPKYEKQNAEEFRVAKNTVLTYFSNSYRFVFVMDLSPSAFAADEGDICYIRIFKIVETSLYNLVKNFTFPGSSNLFHPQIYVTFCAFSPFLCFTDDSVLLQGIHVTEENSRSVLFNLRIKFDQYINNLCSYFQPYIREWQANRRKFRSFAKDIECALYASDSTDTNGRRAMKNVGNFISDFRFQLTDTACAGFVQPDWSLISMIRMGILGVQMLLPDNAQSHLVLITDGCCAIPDGSAFDQIIGQLRAYTITCSFIQSDSSVRGAALGHVSFPELFKFIATATFGRFMFASELINSDDSGHINFYHRAFLAWNFQKAFLTNDEPPMPEFLRTNIGTSRSHQYSQQYKTSVYKLLYVRMREGYTIKDVNHFMRDGKNMIKIFLTLLWKPNISIEYVILAPWRKSFQKICKISVEFYVESSSSSDLKAIAPNDEDSLQGTVENMVQMDNLLVHMHAFNLYPAYYKIPRDLAQKTPFFEMRNGKIYVANAFNKAKYREFAQFWLPICVINESMWRKWVHLHTLRLVLKEDDPLPKKIFTGHTNEFEQIQCREAGRQVLELFSRKSTFVLLKDQCFVNILFTRDQAAPQYFYVLRIQYDSPCMIIKIAFVGGMSEYKRTQVMNQLQEELDALSMIRAKNVFVKVEDPGNSFNSRRGTNSSLVERQTRESVVKLAQAFERPIERVLVRYSRVPLDVANIVRLENTNEEIEIREMIMHNAVSKYLSCRRTVWELKPTFPRLQVPDATMEFTLQLIVKRRLEQGFSIAYGANGIVSMIRQVDSPNQEGIPRIQQCVVFGPILTETDLLPPIGPYDTDYPSYMEVLRREDAKRRPKSWPRLATEVWLEPPRSLTSDGYSADKAEQEMRAQLLKEDDTIIRSIFTFDQLMRAAESGLHAEEAHVLNKVASVLTRETLSKSVYAYKDLFDPKALMDNADTREFMLLPGLGYSETEDSVRVDARLESLLKYVQAELMKFSHCCVDALDDAFLWDIVETCEDHFGISRFYAPENWSFDEDNENDNKEEDTKHERRQVGAKFLIQSMNDRDLLRQSAVSDGSTNESRCSDDTFSSTKNATSCGGPNSPSEFVCDDDDDERRGYDVSPLSRSMTFYADPYGAAEEASTAALTNLDAKLENENQLRANSVPGVASDSEDNVLAQETNEDTNTDTSFSQIPMTSFITPDLLNEYDQAIAFSSSSIYDIAHSPSSASSTTSEKDNQSEEPSKSKKQEDKQASNTKPTKKMSGDRSRNASGMAEKKLSREEGVLGDSFRAEKTRHVQPDIYAKNEEKEEAIKKFPAIPLGGFGLYARRVGSHRMILFFVPKNAKTVKLLMPHCVNSFPVFVYFVDKLKMAQRFVEKGCGQGDGAERGIRTIVEDFTQKARVSTLAFLNQQLHERFTAEFSQNFVDDDPVPLEEFYLRALDSQLRAEIEPTRFNLGTFDLRQYAEKVFEEYMFTKAFVAATFSSIGQSVHIPKSVLQEATEYRCEHASLELGSIHSIMQNSCLHLQLYEQLPNRLTNSAAKLDPIEVSPIPNPKAMQKLNVRPFFRLVNGCVSNFNDFAACFDRLLQAHSFKPVPGLPDYYFFWPYRKAVLRFANVDDVSTEFADVFRAIGDHPTIAHDVNRHDKLSDEARQRSESGSRIEAGNATQLSPSDMWPLFVQFSVAVIGPDNEMVTAPLSTIPNCLKQLTNVCSTKALQLQTEGLTGQNIRIAVDLYILTWPLPQQSPFRVNDPHLVYARYQETQAQLATLHQYPSKRREWILKMAEKQHRRLKREASSRSSDDESDGVDLWAVQGSSLGQSDEEASECSDTTSTSEESEDAAENESLIQDENELLLSNKYIAHNRLDGEFRLEEHSKNASSFLAGLPKTELSAIKKLQASIKRMLAAEQLFEWARKCEGENVPQPTLRLLSTVCQFVSRIAPADILQQQITTNVYSEAVYNTFKRSIIFTGDHNEGIKLLCQRLTNLRIEYIHLRRFDPNSKFIDDSTLYDDEDKQLQAFINTSTLQTNSNKNSTLFYACFVDNLDAFKEFHSKQMMTARNAQEVYKEPATPPPSSSPTTTPEGSSTPQRSHRIRRASSWSPTLDRKKSVQPSDMSSSDFGSSSGDDTFDVFEPLKDTPNDRLSSSSDPTHSSSNREHRRSRLKRQLSRHYSSSNDSLHICSDGETSSSCDRLKKRRSSGSLSTKSRDKTPEAIVGSEGTIIGAEQVWGGENAPNTPTKCAGEGRVEMRNGFPLDWLISCNVYKANEDRYNQKLTPFLHDFWLIFHVEQPKGTSREGPQVTVHFLRRHNSPHTQLIRDALKILEEQIHVVNQQLLLERMHATEECDQLLIDSPDPADEPKPIHRRITFYVMDTKSGKMLSKEVPSADESERQRRETSVFDDDESLLSGDSGLLQQARARFSPGHFACDIVWHNWFEIHPRLQPASRFASGSVDWGFRTLQAGLERFAVKNRPNLYVFKEQTTGNVVYLRLFSNDSTTMEQFKKFPYNSCPEPPSDSRQYSHVLLAVHGVEKPSDEITELLKNLLEKKLNSRILSEIQDVLLKNTQVRLEISDAHFIQQDVFSPTNVFYFALPSAVHQLLRPLIHYFEQQALLFCLTPHFREQSGINITHNSGTSTPRGHTTRSPNPSKLQQNSSSCLNCSHDAFVSYTASGAPTNPDGYEPMFFLLNQPPSQGRRDIGLACIEVKIVDTNLMPVNRSSPTLNTQNLIQVTRQLQQYLIASKMDNQQRLDLFNSLTKVRRIKSPYSCGQEKGKEVPPTAFVQLAIWQNGKLDGDALDERFRLCIQQTLIDLYTEFGLLSMRLFDATRPNEQQSIRCPTSPNPPSSQHTLQPQSSTELTWSRSEPINLDEAFMKGLESQQLLSTHESSQSSFADKASSDMDLYSTVNAVHAPHEDFLPATKQSVRTISGGSGLRSATSDKNLDTASSSIDELIPSSTAMRPTRIASVGTQVPLSIYAAAASALSKRAAMASSGRNKSEQYTSMSTPSSGQVPTNSPPPVSLETGEYLRDEFALSAANWMDFVATNITNKVQSFPPQVPLNHSSSNTPANNQCVFKRCTFTLECDRTMRKVIQVVFDRLSLYLLGERCVCMCRPLVGTNSGQRRLQLLWNAASLSENVEKDYGRVLNVPFDGDSSDVDPNEPDIDIALLAYNEREYEESLRYVQHQGRIKMPETLARLCNSASREAQPQLFPPHKEPFIPRKRLLYVVARNEILTLFLYNYSIEICEIAREIVERTVLWHNTRSRLLCDIGLHKLGITHLSTLSDSNNSYLLLTWVDPETLINHDYPPDDLKMPDFSRIPRKYAQLLFKLYRFAEPAFVGKQFAPDPFDDQTQQMLTLREDVKGKLHDHRLFGDIHKRLLKGESQIHEDKLYRITSRSHHSHYVKSPLLLFTSWRYRIAEIRNNIGTHEENLVKGQVADGGLRLKHSSGSGDFRPIQLSPVPPDRKKQIVSQQQTILSPVKATAEQSSTVKLLPQLLPSIGGGTTKARSKTTHGATQPSLKQYMKRPAGMTKEPSLALSGAQKLNTTLSFRVSEQELCLLKVQYMLVEDYVDYLQKIGLTLLKINSPNNSQAYNLQYSPDCAHSPNAWLYVAQAGGIIFAHVTFVEPYFSVRFLFWNSSQLSDHMYANQTIPEQELLDMQEIELLKNDLIQQSHVHSFTYDFHLRMVSKYLTGGISVLFNPGYNTNAFLIDFLQYYNCRPPYARDCIYEERAVFQPLRVKGATIWDYFLSNDQYFGWNVIRLKTLSNRGDSDDEFMLISKEQREISGGQTYQLICAVLKGAEPSRQNVTSGHQIELKLYVLMVSEDLKHPLSDNTTLGGGQNSRARLESGEFARRSNGGNVLASSAPSPLIISPKKSTGDGSNTSSGSKEGGEFTRIEKQSVKVVVEKQQVSETPKTPTSGHISRIQSCGGTADMLMLDELIAMSRNEIMNDVGLQPSTSRRSERHTVAHPSKCSSKAAPSQKDEKLSGFRRRATSSDVVSAQKSLRQLASLRNKQQKDESLIMREPSASMRSSSSDAKLRFKNGKRRNSDFPLKAPLGGSLTRLDYHTALDNVWKRSGRGSEFHRDPGSTHTSGSSNELFSIEKVPLRRHRQNFAEYMQKRNNEIVLPPEQVIYVHYFSNQQRRLQHLLEESAAIKKSELEAFVFEAERTCYLNELWKMLLSSKSSMYRQRQSTLFSTSSTKHDSGEGSSSIKIPQIEMDPSAFDSLMQMICIEALIDEEPRLTEALRNVNFGGLCMFLVQHYEKLYRYFERASQRYLIILNPSCLLDSAMMLRDSPNGTELLILFKNTDAERRKKQNFASTAVHEQFEKLMNFITTYLWLNIIQHSPSLK